ncbi:hypothetical protein HGO38_08820 [Rhizobium sp. CG5]|uniref:hypothetical protein n=1 Tax=Rhizobium sp. CG5 TaxID=2726076 RepID=UPI0020344341|nr:hypothetical protein [Rhizobium sp. CG5]MCM2473579.1 hypothetical protein [Rhizobium sp. CG5]
MMDAATKPMNGVSPTGNRANRDSSQSDEADLFDMFLPEAPGLVGTGAAVWEQPDPASHGDGSGSVRRVAATWLDAMPADKYDRATPAKGEISAVNSDDNGLYRMFRSLSP